MLMRYGTHVFSESIYKMLGHSTDSHLFLKQTSWNDTAMLTDQLECYSNAHILLHFFG